MCNFYYSYSASKWSFFIPTHARKAIEDEAEATIERYEEAWKNSDAEGIVALMTDDGICMLPGMDIIKGKESKFWIERTLVNILCVLGDDKWLYQLMVAFAILVHP